METKEHILISAQRFVQQRGFNGFSYADVADQVGIRKASLHHHFATKADLGSALIETYAAQFNVALAHIDQSGGDGLGKLHAYVDLYRSNLKEGRMCMCGMLATESLTLETSMLPMLKQFFARNTDWLEQLLAEGRSQGVLFFDGVAAEHARAALSTLQGASLVCRGDGDLAAFDRTSAILIKAFSRTG
jgi:TetR/AcrR family transcriptional regulator, transcriptional repressor for nem operon